jgi:hypothetical protein
VTTDGVKFSAKSVIRLCHCHPRSSRKRI